MRTGLCLTLLALFSALDLAAKPLLPPSLGDWERTEWKQADARQLENLAGAQAGILREYGSVGAEQGAYRRGREEWQATVHRMQDRSGAYGAYTLLRSGGEQVSLGEAGARTRTGLIFFQGNYFVTATGNARTGDLEALARHLAVHPGQVASLPTLPSYLPSRGLVGGSECYLLGPLALAQRLPLLPGDWAGFAYGAEAELARYRSGGGEATLLLISYPTPQIARQRLADFERLFNLNGAGNPSRPLAYARRTSTLIAFLSGAESGQAAASLLGQVRYETGVSWSDPSARRPDLDWIRTILNIFIGTGLFLLVALVCGVLYGVLRLLMKRLFPGTVFDRTGDEMIMLRIDPPHYK